MKKRISVILTLALLIAMLSGCAGTTVVVGNCTCPTEEAQVAAPETTPATQAPAPEAAAPVEGALKTGLSIVTSLRDSVSATAEEAGKAAYDVTVAAVTLDASGIIRSCIIDSVGTEVKFDATGAITSDLTAAPQTKGELGEAYGMKAYAGSQYEWNEQAAALAAYAVGKTVEELKSGAVSESGYALDADLATTATIYIGGYVSAIEKAAANAQALGAQGGDTLKLAVISSLGSSAAATAESDGTAQLDCDVTAITMKGDTITSCYIDSLQAKVGFDNVGALTTDVMSGAQTKNELGEGYGMKAYAGSAYEWNEQAANFAAYITGKTAADVSTIAVTETTAPADADLSTGVTIAIGGFQNLIAKAAAPAEGALKTGLAVITDLSGSTSATAEADGTIKYDVTIAAVAVDEAGVIQDCIIDAVGTDVVFDASGAFITDLTFSFPQTKNELGENYGMKAYAGSKYEWNEQAAALAKYAVGKTVDELKNGAVSESGYAADADLATTATIYIGGYVTAIEKAVANAQALGAHSGDVLKLAVTNRVDGVTSNLEDTHAELLIDVAVLTMNGDTITSCYIDSLQAPVSFNAAGEISSDITSGVQTKNEKGEAYGMKLYGSKYEWNEQAANFAAYVTGKTPSEVAGIAVNELNAPIDVDLAAGVTISIRGFLELIAKAAG